MPNTLLIVDDDKDFREEFKDFLYGYDVKEASNGREALELLRRANTVDLVILDVHMPGLGGIDVLTEMKKTDPGLGIIILTGYSSKDVAIEALKGHADDYIEKPLDPVKTRKIIERVLEATAGGGDINTSDLRSKIEKVKRFVERNCFKKTTLEDAAKAICLSPKYLSRVFKEQMHISFSQFKLGIKIDKSKKLLRQAGYNINQISEKLGYENAESFIRQFKKFTGTTPTGYRKNPKRTQPRGR